MWFRCFQGCVSESEKGDGEKGGGGPTLLSTCLTEAILTQCGGGHCVVILFLVHISNIWISIISHVCLVVWSFYIATNLLLDIF